MTSSDVAGRGWGTGITVAVGAVVLDAAGRVLLVKHVPERGGFWQRRWICSGGRLERGEAIMDGIRREVREETGLEIEPVRLLPPFERILKDEQGATLVHVIYLDAVARVLGGTLVPASDVGEAQWFDAGEVASRRDELHEDTQRLLVLAEILE